LKKKKIEKKKKLKKFYFLHISHNIRL